MSTSQPCHFRFGPCRPFWLWPCFFGSSLNAFGQHPQLLSDSKRVGQFLAVLLSGRGGHGQTYPFSLQPRLFGLFGYVTRLVAFASFLKVECFLRGQDSLRWLVNETIAVKPTARTGLGILCLYLLCQALDRLRRGTARGRYRPKKESISN